MTTIVPKELQINKFKVNHWYIYTGTKPKNNWVTIMDAVLNNNPVKCIYSNNEQTEFNTMSMSWNWGDLSDWIEVKEVTSNYDRCEIGEYFYNRNKNSIVKNNSGSAMFCEGKPCPIIIRQSIKKVDKVPSNKVHYSDIKLPIIITDIVCTGEVLETLNKSFKLDINLTRHVRCLYVKAYRHYEYSHYEYQDVVYSRGSYYKDIPTIKYSDIDFGVKKIEVGMSGMEAKVLKQRIGTTEFEVGKQYRMKTKEELIAMGFKDFNTFYRLKNNSSDWVITPRMMRCLGELVTLEEFLKFDENGYNSRVVECLARVHTDWFHLHDPQQKSFSNGSIKKKSKYISITKTKIESKEYKTHKPKYIKLTKSKQGSKLSSGVDPRCI
jgi:hypothetical protein